MRSFALDVRRQVGVVDAELAVWLEQALLAADPFPPTLDALVELGVAHARAIAVGKAAVAMALAWQAAGGAPGLAVVPVGTAVPAELREWKIVHAEHPLPGEGSFRAGAAALRVAAAGGDVVLLLSGGASAMMEAAILARAEHERLSHELHALGLPIATWNAARALLSRIKAGGLAAAVEQAGGTLHTLYASDVPGDAAAVVGSGPGTPVAPQVLEAAVGSLPDALREAVLRSGTERAEPVRRAPARCVLPRHAPAQRAAGLAQAAGRAVRVLDPLDEGVAAASKRIRLAVDGAAAGEVLVLWGEPLVALPARPGPGGRTTVLAATLWAHNVAPDGLLAMVGTDGVDGASGLGGCYARLQTGSSAAAARALAAWRTAGFFTALPLSLGGGVPARRTGTNCADVGLLLPGGG